MSLPNVLKWYCRKVKRRAETRLFIWREMMADRYNASRCTDSTAQRAVENIEQEQRNTAADKRAGKLMGTLLRMADLAGFVVEEKPRIVDRRTGRRYR